MSSTVDNRIVNMVFDNKQFQQGIQQSTNSLEKFDQELNQFTNSGHALGNLSAAVDTIADRFTWLGDLGFRAMGRIKEAILDVVETGVKQLNAIVNPFAEFSSGFDEYELKMGSIQTIMAGTGESLETVNKYLYELNLYADQTIYSFQDMTQNIGKFTNAGVKLKDAVGAIQGVANLAAVSGANANEASRAMYNFAQALSAGHVKLIDWKSIENANMATMEFKNYLLEAGVAAGTLTKSADGMFSIVGGGKKAPVISATHEFNESLKEGWLTTQVLVDTLGDYADKQTEIGAKASAAATEVKTLSQLMDTLHEAIQSGWAQSFETILGDFNEAKELWTGISKSVGESIELSAKARNAMLDEWKGAGGRTALINGVTAAYNGLTAALGTVSKAFRNVFPPMTGKALAEWTKGFESFMKMIAPSEKTLSQLTRIFTGLFNAVSLIIQPFAFAYEVVKKFFSLFIGFSADNGIISWLLEMTASVGDYITSLNEAFKSSNLFGAGLEAIDKFIAMAQESLSKFVDFLKTNPLVQGLVNGLTNGVKMVVDAIVSFATMIKDKFCELLGIKSPSTVFYDYGMFIVEGLVDGIKYSISFIAGVMTSLAVAVKEGFVVAFEKTGNFFVSLGGIIANAFSTSLNAVRTTMANFAASVASIDFSPIDAIKEKMASLTAEGTILGSIGKAFTAFVNMLRPVFSWIASTFGPMIDFMVEKLKSITLSDIGNVLSGIGAALTGGGLFKFFTGLNTVMGSFSGVGKAFTNVLDGVGGSIEAFQGRIKAGTLMTIAKAVALLSVSLIALSFIPWDNLWRGITGISVLMAELSAAMVGLNFAFAKFGTGVGKMSMLIGLGAAVLLLAFALRTLANINKDGLDAALLSMTGIMALVTLFARLTSAVDMKTTMFQLMGLGLAIKMFAAALVSMAGLSLEQAAVGVGTFMMALATLGIFLLVMSENQIKNMGTTLMGIAIGMYMLGKAIKSVGDMKFPVLVQGIAGLVVTLLAMAAILEKFPAIGAVKLTNLAGAMIILSIAIGILGKMNLLTLVKGVVAMGASLYVIGTALKQFPGSQIPALIGLAFAITLLAVPMAAFGQMDVFTIAKALAAVGGSLIVIGAGLKDFPTGKIPGLIGLAFAMNLLIPPMVIFGMMSVMSIAKGLVALGGSLIVIAAGLKAFTTSGMDMIKTAIGLGVIAAALTLLAVPIILLGIMPWDVLIGGLIAIAGALAIIAIAMKFLPDMATMQNVSNGLLKMALGIAAIGAVMIVLGLFDFAVLIQGLLGVAGAVASIVVILKTIPENLPALAKNLLLVAAAIGALMGVIYFLGTSMDGGQMFAALGVLGGTLIILAFAVNSFPDQKTMLGFAIGLGAIAAALTILALPLYLLSQFEWEGIGKALVVLAGALIVIGAASALIGAGALSMIAFGAALILIGAGALLVVMALEKLVDLLARIVDWFTSSAETVKEGASEIGESMVEGFVGGMMSFVTMITDAVKWISDKVISGFKWLFGIKSPSTVMWGIGENNTLGLAGGQTDPSVMSKLKDSVDTVAGTTIDEFKKKLDPDKMTGAVDSFMENGVVKGFKEGSKDAQSMASAFGPGVVDKAKDGFDPAKMMESTKELFNDKNGAVAGLLEGKGDMTKTLTDMGVDLEAVTKGELDPAKFKQMTKDVVGEPGMTGGLKEGSAEIAPAAKTVGETMLTNVQSSIKPEDYIGVGKSVIDNIILGLMEGQTELTTFLLKFGSNFGVQMMSALNSVSIKNVSKELLAGEKNSLLAGFEEGKAELFVAFDDIGTTLFEKLSVQIDPLRYRVLMFNAIADNGLLGGLLEARVLILTALADLAVRVYEVMKLAFAPAPYEVIGYNIVAGLVRGIQSGEIALLAYVTNMAKRAINAAKSALDIHSPSGVFAEIGKNVDDGFAQGVIQNMGVVTDATSTLGNTAADSMKQTLSGLQMEDMDMEVKPVISPVLDLDNVRTDARAIPTLLNKSIGGTKVNVAATSSSVRAAAPVRSAPASETSQQTTQTKEMVINNTFNVKNESDARRVSKQLGVIVARYQQAKGVPVS